MPRDPVSLWNWLLDEAAAAEIDAVVSASDEDIERELAAAGFDVAAEKAAAEAFLASLESPAAAPTDAPKPARQVVPGGAPAKTAAAAPPPTPRKRPRPIVVFATIGIAAAGAAGIYAATRPSEPPITPAPVPSFPPPAPPPEDSARLVAAATLRRDAKTALGGGHPQECLQMLDEARERDPAGDADPDVQTLRKAAREMLNRSNKPKP
jgi:hypothetical protein